jgi:hypothetical protein
MPVLKLNEPDEKREIDFELNYLRSLTVRERFRAMFLKTRQIRELLGKRGYRKTVEIIERAQG